MIYEINESAVLTCETKARGHAPIGISPSLPRQPMGRSVTIPFPQTE